MTAGDDEKAGKNGLNGAAQANGAARTDRSADVSSEHDDADTDDAGDEGADAETEAGAEEIAGAESPAEIVELSAACARYVMTKYKVPLDGTQDTLSLVDQYVRDARAEIALRPEATGLIAASIGAYFGEVVKRAFGAEWYAQGDYSGWRLRMRTVFLTFNPLGMAFEALTLGDAEGWHAHLETDPADRAEMEARLRAMPEVADDEFYLPTTRFDVIEMVVEAIAAKMRADNNGDVRFGADDYES